MEGFFRACAETDEVTALDILYHRYGCIPELEFELLLQLLTKAKEETKRAEIYSAWIAILPLMQEGKAKYIPFKEYYDKCTGQNIDFRSSKDILEEVNAIRANVGKG